MIAVVLVSHSLRLAQGLSDLMRQMAPDVPIFIAAGLPGGKIGTSLTATQDAIASALARCPDGVVALGDLGSAKMTVDAALEVEPAWADRVFHVDAPLVEGAIAAATGSQVGWSLEKVVDSAAASRAAYSDFFPQPAGWDPVPPDAITRKAVVFDRLGLHARPAAQIARIVAESGLPVTIESVDAASVLMLLSIGIEKDQEVTIAASGSGATEVVDRIAEVLMSSSGEEG